MLDRTREVRNIVNVCPHESVIATLQCEGIGTMSGVCRLERNNVAVETVRFLQINFKPVVPRAEFVVGIDAKAGVEVPVNGFEWSVAGY
jgi:hypothetical protein